MHQEKSGTAYQAGQKIQLCNQLRIGEIAALCYVSEERNPGLREEGCMLPIYRIKGHSLPGMENQI